MKIAFILPKLSNQGPILVARDLIDSLLDKVELIDVYYFDEGIELNLNCNVFQIGFFQKIDFSKYDVVHTHMLRPDLYVWYHKSKKDRTLFISTLHQNIFDNLKGNYNVFIAWIFERIWLRLLKKQDVVVTLTEEMKKHYSGKKNLNLVTIYNGRNLECATNTFDSDLSLINEIKRNFKTIVCHCLLTKRKGIDQVIRSLEYLTDYSLIILGDGVELENLKKLAIELGVIDRCLFLGFRKNAVDYIKLFDTYVMASYSEGFPLALLEAGLCKVPIVCSNIPIFKELFSKDDLCFFELNDIKSLASAIKICYSKRDDLTHSMFNLINEKYSIKKMSQSYLSLYQRRRTKDFK
jgi:glycosyltransferase involved in cell wall biosynthesis